MAMGVESAEGLSFTHVARLKQRISPQVCGISFH